jgi:hypothetical protein
MAPAAKRFWRNCLATHCVKYFLFEIALGSVYDVLNLLVSKTAI